MQDCVLLDTVEGRWLGQHMVQLCMITNYGSLLATTATFVSATSGPHHSPVTPAPCTSGKRSALTFTEV